MKWMVQVDTTLVPGANDLEWRVILRDPNTDDVVSYFQHKNAGVAFESAFAVAVFNAAEETQV